MKGPSGPLALIIDCGATNILVSAVNERGEIAASRSAPNGVVLQDPERSWLIWNVDAIWKKIVRCIRKTVRETGGGRYVGIGITAFSDDGAPFDDEVRMLYPVISWQCGRTRDVMSYAGEICPFPELFAITGEQAMSQHTLFRFLWLREREPEVFGKMKHWIMFPHILNYRLTGNIINDPTTGDSMMLLGIHDRAYHYRLMDIFGLPVSVLPLLMEPGTVAGRLLSEAADETGLPPGTPVVVCGHDTQFALFGSGCRPGGSVLSSGTWEILFRRETEPVTGFGEWEKGLKNEFDALPGLYNIGRQWIGSGIIEWFLDVTGSRRGDAASYDAFIAEGESLGPGSGGVRVVPSFLPGSGVGGGDRYGGIISGCTRETTPGGIFRAILEGLSFRLRETMEILDGIYGSGNEELIIVGGGTKNRLWNRIRADVLGRPIRLTTGSESTTRGAAAFVFSGTGIYRDADEAISSFHMERECVEPGTEAGKYRDDYLEFQEEIEKAKRI